MHAHRRSRFESLEKRLALAVTATVTDGDLVVSGDADGAVQITAVGAGHYEVRDNGVLIADSTTLTGVNDDIKIDIDATAGADNTVTLDLTAKRWTSLRRSGQRREFAASYQRHRGELHLRRRHRSRYGRTLGHDHGYAFVKLGNGDNSLTVNGQQSWRSRR